MKNGKQFAQNQEFIYMVESLNRKLRSAGYRKEAEENEAVITRAMKYTHKLCGEFPRLY